MIDIGRQITEKAADLAERVFFILSQIVDGAAFQMHPRSTKFFLGHANAKRAFHNCRAGDQDYCRFLCHPTEKWDATNRAAGRPATRAQRSRSDRNSAQCLRNGVETMLPPHCLTDRTSRGLSAGAGYRTAAAFMQTDQRHTVFKRHFSE